MQRVVKISKERYDWTINQCFESKEEIRILEKRGLHHMYFSKFDTFTYVFNDSKQEATFIEKAKKLGLSKRFVISFFALVSNCVNRYINERNLEITAIPKKSEKIVLFNTDFFNDNVKVGDTFYSIDFNNAWWQSAYRQEIISEKIYQTYKNLPEYKMLRQMAFGLTKSETTAIYIRPSDQESTYIIKECKNLHKQVFLNIRNVVYNSIFDVKQKIITSGSNCIGCNVDSITILSNDLDTVINHYNNYLWEYKIIICKRIDNERYLHGNEIRYLKC